MGDALWTFEQRDVWGIEMSDGEDIMKGTIIKLKQKLQKGHEIKA